MSNSRYAGDSGELPDLKGPKTDGVLLRDALTDPASGLFERSEVRLLPEADAREILAAADEFFGSAEADDTLLFYFSGHGRSRSRQLYLCARDTRVDRLQSSSVPGQALSQMAADSFAQTKIIVLDCCHSGAFKGGDPLEGLSGAGRFVIAATSEAQRAADAAARGEASPFTRALVDGLLSGAVDRDGDALVDLDDLFGYLAQLSFDGHAPSRRFDGSGAVPIARRSPTAARPAELPLPGAESAATSGPADGSLDAPLSGERLSESRIEAFRRDIRDDLLPLFPQGLTSGEFLSRAGLLKEGRPTRAAVLLFGENPAALLSSAMVRCVRFRGTRRTDPFERVELHGTIPELVVQARDFVAAATRIGESPSASGPYSEPLHRFPMLAVREIIANAVVHRDYTADVCVQVHLFDDRLEVVSPGSWGGRDADVPDGQQRLGLLEGQSQPRNTRLANALTWVKLVESIGSGVPRSLLDCRSAGSPEPVVLIRDGLITVTLFPSAAGEDPGGPAHRAEQLPRYSRALEAERIARVWSAEGSGPFRETGSGYRVSNELVLTSAHLVIESAEIMVGFHYRGQAWRGPATVAAIDPDVDIALLRFAPPSDASVVAPVRYGRITDRSAFVNVELAGYSRQTQYLNPSGNLVADVTHLTGTVASLDGMRQGVLNVRFEAPARREGYGSPWAGMSGAAVWAEGRIVGVVNRTQALGAGPQVLLAPRIERFLGELDPTGALAVELGAVEPPVQVPAPEPVRASGYLAQVRQLAPSTLLDRRKELAELAAFCRGPEPYLCWEGPAWAGKTALLTTFATRPPEGVDAVAFCVSTRLVGQSDGVAFTESVVEQLSVLLGEDLPVRASASPGAQDALRRELLAEAARRAVRDGRRLLLVVDGLDEDNSPRTGTPSIASLLPRYPIDGLRVVVSRRPVPLPADVPDTHPLRHCPVRTLSSHAPAAAALVAVEVQSLLIGPTEIRDTVGLLAAAAGGLLRSDLALLVGVPPYRLEEMLLGRLGRILQRSTDVGGISVRLAFGHEEFARAARELLGPALMAEYARRLRESDGGLGPRP